MTARAVYRAIARHLGACLLLCAAACDGCGASPPVTDAGGAEMGVLQPWTLGAARTEAALVLPPPCIEREPALMTVLGRATRIAAERHSLGMLWVAEGPSDLEAWRADASGILRLRHGRTVPTTAPWPERGHPVIALSGGDWLLAYDRGEELLVSFADRPQSEHHRVSGNHARAIDMACDETTCGLIVQRGDTVELLYGARDAPAKWQQKSLAEFGSIGLAVHVGEEVTAVVRDAQRARFVHVDLASGQVERGAVLGVAPSLLALVAEPPATMTEPSFQTVDGCPTEGGLVVTVGDHPPVRLRSSQPATSGTLSRMRRGWFATWLAPVRCRSRRHMLHATVLDDDGRPLAPVTTMGRADAALVSTVGADVDLWLRHEGDGTVTWLRARCR